MSQQASTITSEGVTPTPSLERWAGLISYLTACLGAAQLKQEVDTNPLTRYRRICNTIEVNSESTEERLWAENESSMHHRSTESMADTAWARELADVIHEVTEVMFEELQSAEGQEDYFILLGLLGDLESDAHSSILSNCEGRV